MAAGTVSVVVNLVDNLSARMKRINEALEETDKKGKKVNTTFQALQAGLAGITVAAVYQSLKQVGDALYDIAYAGAQAERVQTAFQVTAVKMGEAWDEALGTIRIATRGTISDMQLMISANKAFALGVVGSSRELAELAKVSTVLGRRTGLGQEQAFERLLVGVGRLSPRILDDLGIAVNLTRLYAEETGKLSSELSQQEKIQALLNYVLKEGQDILKEYPQGLEDAASGFERAQASWTNFINALGQTAPFATATQALEDMTERLVDWQQAAAIKAGTASAATVAEEQARIMKDLEALRTGDLGALSPSTMQTFIRNMGNASQTTKILKEDLAAIDAVYQKILFSSAAVADTTADAAKPAVDFLSQVDMFGDVIIKMFDELKRAQEGVFAAGITGDPAKIAAAQQQLTNVTTLLRIYGIEYNKAAEEAEVDLLDVPSLQKGIVLTAEAAGAVDLLTKTKDLDKKKTDEEALALARWNAYLKESKNAITELIGAMQQRINQDVVEFRAGDNSQEATEAANRLRAALESQLYYIEYVSQAWMNQEDQAVAITQAYNRAKEGLDEYTEASERAAQVAALADVGKAGDQLLTVIPQLRAAMEEMNAAATGPAVLTAATNVAQLRDQVEQLGIQYNIVAAAAGLQLIDIAQLREGKVAAENAAAGVDILNTSQILAKTYAELAGSAFSQEAAALSVFESAVAGARISLMTRIAGAADVYTAAQMGEIFERDAATIDDAAEDIFNSTDTIENKYFQLMDTIGGVNKTFDDNVGALREVGKESGKLAETLQDKVIGAFESLNSVVSGELQDSLNELSKVGIKLDEFLPYEDAPAENARRLAAIMKEGIKDQPWLEEFKSEVPQIFDELVASGNPQEAAARMLREFEKGLRPELIDFEQLKTQIKENLETAMRMEAMGKQLTAELIAEMGPEQGDTIRKFVAKELGTGLDEGFGEDSAAKLMAQFSSVEFKEQMKTAGVSGAENWALGFNGAAPEYLAPFMDLLAAYVTPIVESNIASKQATSKAK